MCNKCGQTKCCCQPYRGPKGPAGPRGPKGDSGSSGIVSSQKVSGVVDQSISGLTPVTVTGATFSLTAGTYFISFTGSGHPVADSTVGGYGIYIDGVLTDVLHAVGASSGVISIAHYNTCIATTVTLAATSTVDVRFFTQTNTWVVERFILTALKFA